MRDLKTYSQVWQACLHIDYPLKFCDLGWFELKVHLLAISVKTNSDGEIRYCNNTVVCDKK